MTSRWIVNIADDGRTFGDGFRSGKKIRSMSFALLALIAFAISAAVHPQARAAAPDTLCLMDDGSGLAAYPSEESLSQAAERAETMVTRGAVTSDFRSAMTVGTTSSAAPSDSSIARYCLAAGQAARASSESSPMEAHAYLLSAFRRAEAAGDMAMGARSAYELGLVHARNATAPSQSGSRIAGVGTAFTSGTSPGGPCQVLLDEVGFESQGRSVSVAALQCAVRKARSVSDFSLSSLASLRLARLAIVAREQGDPIASVDAGQSALAALPLSARIMDRDRETLVTARLIEAALDGGSAAHPELSAAIARLRSGGARDPGIAAFAAAMEARIALLQGDAGRADALLQEAILLEAQRSLPMRMPDWLLLRAQVDPDRRRALTAAAFRALEDIRPLLPVDDGLTGEAMFTLMMRDVYEAAVEAEFAALGSAGTGSVAGVQRVIEAYRQAEIQNLFGSECIPPETPFHVSDLREGELVLYPVVLPDRLELIYAWGSEPGGPRYRRLAPRRDVARRDVQAMVRDLRTLGNREHGAEWQAAARGVYDLLVAPLGDKVTAQTSLVIVSDSSFRGVPFAAMQRSDGRFLIEDVALSVAPALDFLEAGDKLEGNRLSVLSASLEKDVALPMGFFPRLGSTSEEAQIAAAVDTPGARRGKVLEDFSTNDLERAIRSRNVDVLHLATHAAFNGRSDRSFIVADGDTILLSELRDLIETNRRFGDDLDLLVLSACETALGDDQAVMGLAGAAIQAGADSALATLWQVDDKGTLQLMEYFYRELRAGKSRADALRLAQLAMIESGAGNADPWKWAAFTLVGGWR